MDVPQFYDCDIVTVAQDSSLVDAAKLMRQFHVGYLVVVENKETQCIPLGIVTDRDMVIEVVATELDPEVITVGDIMLKNLLTVRDKTNLVKMLEIMTVEGVRYLPVVNQEGALVGVATLDGLLIKAAQVFGNLSNLIANEKENESTYRR
jgi:CBS domain-containing protein